MKPSKRRLNDLTFEASQRKTWAAYYKAHGRHHEAEIQEKKARQAAKALTTESTKPGWKPQKTKK